MNKSLILRDKVLFIWQKFHYHIQYTGENMREKNKLPKKFDKVLEYIGSCIFPIFTATIITGEIARHISPIKSTAESIEKIILFILAVLFGVVISFKNYSDTIKIKNKQE